jgi:hypothetical protein
MDKNGWDKYVRSHFDNTSQVPDDCTPEMV